MKFIKNKRTKNWNCLEKENEKSSITKKWKEKPNLKKPKLAENLLLFHNEMFNYIVGSVQ